MRPLILAIVLGLWIMAGCRQGIPAEKLQAGKKVYDVNCQGCHMENGMGVPRMNPALVNSPYVMGHPGSLIELVLKGSSFFGNADRGFNNEMASFQNLSDREIADMLTYVRYTFAKTNDEVKEEDVKKVRSGTR